jgi:hypothetical protein
MTWTPWRVGRHYGIHVYADDVPIATFHTAADAALAVAAVNALNAPIPDDADTEDDDTGLDVGDFE